MEGPVVSVLPINLAKIVQTECRTKPMQGESRGKNKLV